MTTNVLLSPTLSKDCENYILSLLPAKGRLLLWGKDRNCLSDKLLEASTDTFTSADFDEYAFEDQENYDLIYVDHPCYLSIGLRSLHLLKDKSATIIFKLPTESSRFYFPLFDIYDFSVFKDNENSFLVGNSKLNLEKQEKNPRLPLQRESLFEEAPSFPSEEINSVEIVKKDNSQKKNRKTLLWVMNVCWQGGTALWLLDAIKSLAKDTPQSSIWDHKVIYMHQGVNNHVFEEFQNYGVDISFCAKIDKNLVEDISPSAVLLSNTNPNSIEGGHPWSWLIDNYLTIYIHHTPLYPWIPNVDTEVFVSNYVLRRYDNLKQHLKNPIVIPPGINTQLYSRIERKIHNNKDYITIGYLASDNPKKYPGEILDIVEAAVQLYKESSGAKPVKFQVVGGTKYLKPSPNLSYQLELQPFTDTPFNAYRNFDLFLYKTKENLIDTWGRNITEAMASGLPVVTYNKGGPIEQIDNNINGFLCGDDGQYIKGIEELLKSPEKRFEFGVNARIKALTQFDTKRFAEHIEPILIKNALRD